MSRRGRLLTPEAYDTACDLAGVALLRRASATASVLQVTDDKVWSGFSSGVYIAADRENMIRYVGSALRSGKPIGDRWPMADVEDKRLSLRHRRPVASSVWGRDHRNGACETGPNTH